MREIFGGTLFGFYAEVALIDAERPEAVPQWSADAFDPVTGAQLHALATGPAGILVAAASNTDIEVIVAEGDEVPDGELLGEAEILVGSGGLLVSDMAAFEKVEWPAGRCHVRVYRMRGEPDADQLVFLLRRG